MIVGDIGGTKTQLAFVDPDERYEERRMGELPSLQHVRYFLNDHYDCFEGIVSAYLDETALAVDDMMVLGVAGPVSDNYCQLTNRGWRLDGRQFASRYGIGQVQLLNDLVATFHGVTHLPESDFEWLQNFAKDHKLTRSVISVGTGLGEASLVDGGESIDYLVLPGEGGHKNFAPSSPDEIELLSYYMEKTNHVSEEYLISGDGVQRVYQYLRQQQKSAVSDDGTIETLPSSHSITERALTEPGSIYEKTLLIFSEMLLSEAGNLALQSYSEGGVVIAGGIPPHIIEFLRRPICLSRFSQKGRFEDWLRQLPLSVCTNTAAPLYGAWVFGIKAAWS